MSTLVEKLAGNEQGADHSDALTTFIRKEILHGRDVPLDADQDLLSSGVIDSIGILRMVAFIEERLGVSVLGDDVVFENFHSIGAMARYVEERKAAAG